MKTLIVLALLSTAACAHVVTEKQTYQEGVKEGFVMGHAPQILPIQILPVSLNSGIATQSVLAPAAPKAPPTAQPVAQTDAPLIDPELGKILFIQGWEAALAKYGIKETP